MKGISLLFFAALLAFNVQAKVRVVASTPDLASIAQFIGGDLIKADAITRGDANPHTVEVLPSYMMKVASAELYLEVGLGLDQWAQPIIDGARNGRLKLVDCSEGVTVMNVSQTKVDASMGDVHPQGNPHYWLDPSNGLIVAGTIREALVSVDPEHADQYEANYNEFRSKLETKLAEWKRAAAPLEGLPVVSFHDSWPYFARAFGLNVLGFVEPRPGIEPTPSHTAELINLIKGQQIPLIIREPYYSSKVPDSIAARTGAKVVELAPSVGGGKGADDYFALFDHDLELLLAAKGS